MSTSLRRRSSITSVFVLVGALGSFAVVGGCGTDEPTNSGLPPQMRAVPGCATQASFADATAAARAKLGAVVGEPIANLRSTVISAMSAASWLGDAKIYEEDLARLVTEETGSGKNAKYTDFEYDLTKENLLFVAYRRSQATVEIRRDGAVVHVYVANAKACLDETTSALQQLHDQEVLLAAVPKEITKAELHSAIETYDPIYPDVTDACTRDGTVFAGGGRAGLLPGVGGAKHRLFVEGFSAMTGNVFFTESADGVAWAPGGWSEEHILSFADRGPYADVYSPSPIVIGGKTFLYAAYVAKLPEREALLGRFAQDSGNDFLTAEEVLPRSESGWDSGLLTSPSVLERDGAIHLYYVGKEKSLITGRIGLAVSTDGGKTFTRRGKEPVVRPENFAYPVSSVQDPDVRVVGDHLEMWCTVQLSGGNPSSAGFATIAHLTSTDGTTWTADATPLVLPRGDAEGGGIFAPTVLVRDNDVLVYATALNRNAEPIVERLTCPRSP